MKAMQDHPHILVASSSRTVKPTALPAMSRCVKVANASKHEDTSIDGNKRMTITASGQTLRNTTCITHTRTLLRPCLPNVLGGRVVQVQWQCRPPVAKLCARGQHAQRALIYDALRA